MSRMSRGFAVLAAIAMLVAAGSVAPATAHRHRRTGACAATHARFGSVPRRRLSRAVVCLLDRARRHAGLGTLHSRSRLAFAAWRHALDMQRHRYFSHDSRDGSSFAVRIRRAGYLRRRSGGWALGETLAYGSGRDSTPAALVRAFIHSPPHRAVILDGVYRDVGVGLIPGDPQGDPDGVTLAVDYGRRGPGRHHHPGVRHHAGRGRPHGPLRSARRHGGHGRRP